MGKSYCTECGTELVDFAKFCPNCGKRVDDDIPSDLKQTSTPSATSFNDDVTRLVIKEMGADGINGLDKNELTEKLLYFYDNKIPTPQRIEILMNTFDIDYETADKIEWVSSAKISLFSDYFINKNQGATEFDIEGKGGMLKTDIPISEYMGYVGFIIENDAVPVFKKGKSNNGPLLKLEQEGLTNYSTVDYVDLYETRAVRHSRGSSYGRKGYRVYSGTSTSSQQWTKLGRGKLTLKGDKCYFVGGGQQRIIDTKKIINITYFSNTSGMEISVSNRQKSMKFLLPGRDVEDGKRLANAILNGKTNVALKKLDKDPGNCYIATFVYGSYDACEVLALRKFRDEKLLTNNLGKMFVGFYYKTSPFLIKHFGGKLFKNTSKRILDYMVRKIN